MKPVKKSNYGTMGYNHQRPLKQGSSGVKGCPSVYQAAPSKKKGAK
jgi:hypothetical protein